MLSERDRRALVFLGIAAPVLLIALYVGPQITSLLSGSVEQSQKQSRFHSIYGKMRNFENWQKELEQKQADLHIQVSNTSDDHQVDAFVKAVEDAGRRAKVQISHFRQLPRKLKAVSGSKKVATQTVLIDFVAQWPSLVTFVKEIEGMTVPVVIDQISLTKRIAENKPAISATLQLHIYLFPEAA